MEDGEIIRCLQQRDETALAALQEKYGTYCRTVSERILGNRDDVMECLNDLWLRVWNSIPPEIPQNLKAYLAALTRSISLDLWRHEHRKKRGGSQVWLALEELNESIPSADKTAEQAELTAQLAAFLDTLQQTERQVFLYRYWYFFSNAEIAKLYAMPKNTVASMLFRTRKKLYDYWKE